jgi:hypothetical protein
MREPPLRYVPKSRCRFAITVEHAEPWSTRCYLKPGHNGPHRGRHLPELPYQTISWYKGDEREFITDRDKVYGWRTRSRKSPAA